MRKGLIILLAAMMLAGCGSGEDSSGEKLSVTETTTVKETTAAQPEKAELSAGFYKIAMDTALYYGDSAVPSGEEMICRGEPSPSGGLKISVPIKTGVNELNEAQYEYRQYSVKDIGSVTLLSDEEVRQTVVDYALAMSEKPSQTYELSGEYVGETDTRSDCSGMTELAYLTVGIYLEHYADAQASGGEMVYDNLSYVADVSDVETYRVKDPNASVDYSQLKKGDLLFFLCSTNSSSDNNSFTEDGIGHVGMYIGDGKMVHFTADYGIYNHPCRTEDLDDYQSRVLKVMRVTRYI